MEDFKIPTLPTVVPIKAEKQNTSDDAKDNQGKESKSADKNEDPLETKSQTTSSPTNQCPYKVPTWSAPPENSDVHYKFEVLKSGQIIEEVNDLQKQAFWTFGRLPENNCCILHPTASRFHAVLQYRKKSSLSDSNEPAEGWYIFDLDSTHGTFLNKQRIPPKVFIRIRVGHMLRFGASTRNYILQGPVEDEEPESELSITELRLQRVQQQQTAEEIKEKAREAAEESLRNEGISWGMGEDAEEETDLTNNPYASTNNEELFIDDPKRTLRGYFEREDIPLEYKCDEMSAGSFVCRIELPIDDGNGKPIVAEVVHKGKKKECVVQCALEACRILDRHGVLRQANQEPLKRKTKPKESDSDDDEFWDRTGDIEKRKQRKTVSNVSVTLTYDELVKQNSDLSEQLQKVEDDIANYQEKQKRRKEHAEAQEGADLDSFMENLSEDISQLDKIEIKRLRLEQQRLKSEQQRLEKLLKLAKPYELYGIASANLYSKTKDNLNPLKRQLPMIGKRNQFSKFKIAKLPEKPKSSFDNKALASDEEEMEDEEVDNKTEDEKVDKKIEENIAHECPELEKKKEKKQNIESNDKSNSSIVSTTVNNVKGPAILPHEAEQLSLHLDDSEINANAEKKLNTITEIIPSMDTMNAQNKNNEDIHKKRSRPRQRQRAKRQDVDVEELDDHESTEKYAKWVPPSNQTGDGFTTLNEKYGY